MPGPVRSPASWRPLLHRNDRLDVVEINPRFVDVLERGLRTDRVLAAAADRIRVIPKSITDLDLEHDYDVIVSCLPFTNLDPRQVRAILDQYLTALAPGGCLTYFRYLATHTARRLFDSRSDQARPGKDITGPSSRRSNRTTYYL